MKIPFYQVDAFTNKVFKGNPAAVCLLDSWLDDKVMQNIAAENNLSERGGELFCEHIGDRVRISGHAVLYATGEIHI